MQTKLERLLRYHRQRVFDEKTGDAHGRALGRLKKTKTFRAMCEANRERQGIARGARLTGMGY
jgi:hypothetical protein